MTQQPDIAPAPSAPSQPVPSWLYDFLRRDVGATATGNYRYWRDVLSSDDAARLWNDITHKFTHARTGWRIDWLVQHYRYRLTGITDPKDKNLLRFKIWTHYLARQEGQS